MNSLPALLPATGANVGEGGRDSRSASVPGVLFDNALRGEPWLSCVVCSRRAPQKMGMTKITHVDFPPREVVSYTKETQTPVVTQQKPGDACVCVRVCVCGLDQGGGVNSVCLCLPMFT